MATKSQLKQYFETGKIPTQAQFGELINSFINIPSQNTEDRGNQTLFFGNGEENPYIQGVRTVSKILNNNVVNIFIFSTRNNNDVISSFPLFILNRTSTRAASLNDAQATLRYCIPNKLNIDNFVMHGLDCNNSTDDEIITEIGDWEFKRFERDNLNRNILNICTTIINGTVSTFSTFVFNLADINVKGTPKRLPIELMTIVDNDLRSLVDGPYYIKNNVNKDSLSTDWNALISSLDKPYDTVTTTNSMVVTKCNDIKNNYMEKR